MPNAQSLFIDYSANLKRAVVNQRALIYSLLCIIVLLSVTVTYVSTHQAAFLIPYGLSKKIKVAVNQITPAYISSIGLSDAATYFNIDRTNIDEQNALFLSRVTPPSINALIVKLKKRADYFHNNDVAQQFYPYERYVKSHNNDLIIKGKLVRWLSGKCLFSRVITLTIHYTNKNGHLYIHQWSYNDE